MVAFDVRFSRKGLSSPSSVRPWLLSVGAGVLATLRTIVPDTLPRADQMAVGWLATLVAYTLRWAPLLA